MAARIRLCGSELLYRTGVLHLLEAIQARLRGQRLVIFTFHALSDPAQPEGRYFRDGMNIDGDDFAHLIRFLNDRYRLLPLETALDELAAGTKGPRAAVITFDDGYKSVYDIAFPVLQRFEAPATVFLPTDFIGTGRLLWWDEVPLLLDAGQEAARGALRKALGVKLPKKNAANAAVSRLKYMSEPEREAIMARLRTAAGGPKPAPRVMMTWNEAREMAAAGVEFGSHTVSHCYLADLERATLEHELGRSRDILQEELGVAPTTLAYPDGRYDELTLEVARGCGYRCAVTTVTGNNDRDADTFALRRHDGSQEFTAGTKHLRAPVVWSEVLGVWDTLLLRRFRTPERYSPRRRKISAV